MMMMMVILSWLLSFLLYGWMDAWAGGWVDGPSLIFVVTPMICTEAKQGNAEVVSSLLRAGADKDQLTSKGRSALQLARSADVYGSHLQAVGLCGSGVHMIQTYKPTDRRTGIQTYRRIDIQTYIHRYIDT